ncbi:MAG: TonB-dependent receptor [Kordiimonadaceae bacterium]|nr:TonB-dependent receptor [Kordiimonadaceae bacterium]
MFKSKLLLASAITTALSAYPSTFAHAADETAFDDIIVSTASRSDKTLSSEGRAVAVLSSKELELVGATHINEAMLRLPGVNFSRNNGLEYLASIRSPIFTGAGACGAFLVAQDGIALRSAGFCNVNELFEGFTEVAERIEVTRGPGSALYGSNALHGIINVVTPSADSDDGFARAEAGSYGYARLTASKGYTSGNHGVRIMGSVTHDGGYRDDAGFDQQKIGLRHDYKGDTWDIASNISFTHLDQDTAGYITGLDAYKDRTTAKTNPNPEAYRKATSFRYWSRLSRELSDGVRWQITPYFRSLDMEFLMHFLPGKPLEENSQTSVGLQNGFYFGEGSALEVITGFDLEYTRGSLEQIQASPTTGSAFLQATIPSGKQYDYDVDSFMIAGFLQATLELSDTLQLTAGARLEHISYDYTNNMVSGRTDENGNTCGFGGCRYSRPESGENSYTAFSPKVSLLYDYTADHQLFITASHGFRAPQAAELYRLQRVQTVADLKNVSLKSIELGFRGSSEKANYSLSVYAMQKDNYIFRDADFFNVNGGKSDHVGAEASLEVTLSDTVTLRGNASVAKHQYDFDYISGGVNLNGKDIDTAPRHFGSAQLTWSPTEKFSTELEWVHMGSYYLDPENQHEYEGHNYLNLRGTYKISDTLSLFARVINLTNVKYAERADYTRFTDERYFPGKPTSVYAGIKANF